MSHSELLEPFSESLKGLSNRIEKRWIRGSQMITSAVYLVGVQEKF